MYNDVITLVSIARAVDEIGDPVEVESTKEVFAAVRSVGMRETYEALAAGLKPELVFVLADYYDYDDQEEIEHEGTRYRVLRTYRKDVELEIVVTR